MGLIDILPSSAFLLIQTLAIFLTAALLPGLRITSTIGAVLIVVTLAFVNAKIWHVALFFHIPDSVNFQTFVLIVTNGVIFWILVKLLPGIEIDGCLPALLAPIIFTMANLFIEKIILTTNWQRIVSSLASSIQRAIGM